MAQPSIRKADLPADRRYSRDRIWIMPSPATPGAWRVGVAFAAAAPPGPGGKAAACYFVHVEEGEGGALVPGRSFGFVEAEAGRIQLTAPLAAQGTGANGALAADPGLVAGDPFGEGWLCEVTGVDEAALERLFDRDSFYAYLRFEAEARRLGLSPTINARYRLDQGEPWPIDLRLDLGGKLMVRSRALKYGRNETFTPQWYPGDSWKVKTTVRQPSTAMVGPELAPSKMVERTWKFDVLDDQGDAGGAPCYVVKAIEVDGAPAQTFLRLSIAKEDFTLRLVEEVSAFDPRSYTSSKNNWGAETYVEVREPRELIVDFPMFPEENCAERRVVVAAPGVPEIKQEAEFPDPVTMTIACETDPGPLAGSAGGVVRSEQTWRRGLPWWKSAKRASGGTVVMTGELVS